MIDWDDLTKFISGFVVPMFFGIIIALSFVLMVLRKYRIESWEDFKNCVRFTVIRI